jgi:chromosome segregation ATPase
VTYDGDIYEQGTLSGGYINQSIMVLPQYAELQGIDERIKRERGNFDGQRQKYENYQRAMNEYRNKQKELESRVNRREKIKTKLMNISLNIKKRDFKKELEDIEAKLRELQKQKEDRTAKIEELKSSIKTHKVKSIK